MKYIWIFQEKFISLHGKTKNNTNKKEYMNKEYLKIARMLYKPSHKVEYMVLNMIEFFKNKNISNIHFPMGEVTFEQENGDKLRLKEICSNTQEKHLGIEVHWWADNTVSTTSDPFCSAFILSENELSIIWEKINEKIR